MLNCYFVHWWNSFIIKVLHSPLTDKPDQWDALLKSGLMWANLGFFSFFLFLVVYFIFLKQGTAHCLAKAEKILKRLLTKSQYHHTSDFRFLFWLWLLFRGYLVGGLLIVLFGCEHTAHHGFSGWPWTPGHKEFRTQGVHALAFPGAGTTIIHHYS